MTKAPGDRFEAVIYHAGTVELVRLPRLRETRLSNLTADGMYDKLLSRSLRSRTDPPGGSWASLRFVNRKDDDIELTRATEPAVLGFDDRTTAVRLPSAGRLCLRMPAHRTRR
jgi:hypothetical protein